MVLVWSRLNSLPRPALPGAVWELSGFPSDIFPVAGHWDEPKVIPSDGGEFYRSALSDCADLLGHVPAVFDPALKGLFQPSGAEIVAAFKFPAVIQVSDDSGWDTGSHIRLWASGLRYKGLGHALRVRLGFRANNACNRAWLRIRGRQIRRALRLSRPPR